MSLPTDKQRSDELTKRYDIEARHYARYWAPVLHPAACRMVGELTPATARCILDIGAGAGTLLPVLRDKFPEALVVGADRSSGMLALAGRDAPLAVMDALDLGFVTNTFDVAVMSFVLFHLPDAVTGLKEVRRVLHPGGVMCLSTWAEDMESRVVRIWNEELEASGAPAAETFARLANHDLMDTTTKVTGLLTSAGFESVQAAVYPHTYRMALEDFVGLRTYVGSTAQRLGALDDASRERCVGLARERLAALSGDDFTLRMKIIFASGIAP